MADKEEDAGELMRDGNVKNGRQVALVEPETLDEAEMDEAAMAEQPKRKVFNLKFFVIIVCLVGIVLMIETNQRIALLTTLERRFGFSSAENGIIMSSYDVGHVIVLGLLSVIGHKIHQPRMCGLGGIFSIIASFLWVAPHIIFGPGKSMKQDPESIVITNLTNASSSYEDINKCFESYNPNRTLSGYCDMQQASSNGTTSGRNEVETWVSFAFFFLSQSMLGAALAPFLTVDFTYIDDNTDPQTSAICVGLILSIGSFGSVLGFLLGAFTLGYPVDFQPTTFTQEDPEWIGAWWLGSVVTAFLMFLVCLPLFFFPRALVQRPTHKKIYRMEEDGKEHTQAEKFRAVMQRKPSRVDDDELQDISKKSKPLFKNVVFICCTVAMSTVFYLPGGVFVFLPKYYEVQFTQRPTIANIITSFVTVGAMASGTFAGGYIASYFGLERKGNAKLIVVTVTIGIACFFGAMFIGCDQQQLAGNIDPNLILNASLPCNFNCSCGMEFSPVCGEDNIVYYSACHAGCKDIVSVVGETVNYANCTCLSGGNGTAVSGQCDLGCKMIIPYSILIFFCNFAICLASSPFMALLIRSVEPTQKALALGINNISTSLFGTIPAPMIYGALIDNACEMISPSCDAGGGGCILYSNSLFRYYLHGLTIVVISIADASLGVAWANISYVEKRQRKKESSQVEENPETVPMVTRT